VDERIEHITRLAGRQHGVFSRRQAHTVGVTKNSIRNGVERGRWQPIATQVLCMAGVPDGPLVRASAAVLEAGPGAALSHTSAAWLHRLPGFPASPVHVIRTHGKALHHGVLSVVHRTDRLPPSHRREVAGIPVTSVARTLLDLGAVVHPGRVERAVDTALARLLVTYEDLAGLLQDLAASGRPGVRALRQALAGRSPTEAPPASELERRFRDLLRRHGLPQPERQVVLGTDAEVAGRVDCYFREARLVVELDGRAYHTATLDRLEDGRRDLVLLRSGRRVLRLGWQHVVERPLEVVTALRELLSCAA
jgi:very-short-patch-repair endonuclease